MFRLYPSDSVAARLGRMMNVMRLLAIVVVVSACSSATATVRGSSEVGPRLNTALSRDGLFLPPQYTKLEYNVGDGSISSPFYLKFSATPNQVRAFISNSHVDQPVKAVQGVDPQTAARAGWPIATLPPLTDSVLGSIGQLDNGRWFAATFDERNGQTWTVYYYSALDGH